MLNRNKYIDEIINKLGWIKNEVSLRTSLNLLDLNIHMEHFLLGLLNLTYGYQLENLNTTQTNYASIDLGDSSKRIAIQVTSDNDSQKIKETLSKFFERKYNEKYDRVIILIIGDKKNYTTTFVVPEGFNFSKDADIWDFAKLVKDISQKETTKLHQIASYFNQELELVTGYVGSGLYSIAEDMKNKTRALSIAKLMTPGLSKEVAEEIIKADIASNKYQYILDEANQGKHYLVGGYGSGKSHAVLVLCQRLLEKYIAGSFDSLPLYTHVRDIVKVGSIQSWVENLSISSQRYLVFIDGLDEINFSEASKIIEEVLYLSTLEPENKFVFCSRPLTYLADQRKQIPVQTLSMAEQKALISIIADEALTEYYPGANEPELQSCLELPLFCIIYALLKGKRPFGWIKTRIDLLTAFIESATRSIVENSCVYDDLMSLAICTTDNGYRDIHLSEVMLTGSIDSILKTGLVEKQGDYICFPLVIVAQFLAAKALQLNKIDRKSISSSRAKIELWKYPLSITFSQASFENSFALFSEVFCTAPGLAAQIISDGTRSERSHALPTAEECGNKITRCVETWNTALGPLSQYISPSTNYNPQTLGVCTKDNSLAYVWYKLKNRTPVEELPFEAMIYLGNVHSLIIPAQSTWPWIVTFREFSTTLEKSINEKAILGNCPQLKKELFWEIASTVAKKGGVLQQDIPIKVFEELASSEAESFSVSRRLISSNDERIAKKDFLDLLNKYTVPNAEHISPPFPASDQPFVSGYVWSCYSKARYLDLVKYVYGCALEEYLTLVNTVFSSFRPDFPTYLLSPCRIVGDLEFDPYTGDTGAPGLKWYILALPESSSNEIDIDYRNRNKLGDPYDAIIANRKIFRPKMKNIGIIQTSEALFLNCYKPVTNTVYKWIASELKKLGWIKNYSLR